MDGDRIAPPDQQALTPVPKGDRAFVALLLLKRGYAMEEIAPLLPSGSEPGAVGVSRKTAEIIVRAGARSLLSLVVMNRRTENLPAELWPPEEVRQTILAEHRGRSYRPSLMLLRAWIEGRL